MQETHTTFALVVVVLAQLAAIFAIASSARLAREAMRRQADMERLLTMRELARNPETHGLASVVASMTPAEALRQESDLLVRTPMARPDGPQTDSYGFDRIGALEE